MSRGSAKERSRVRTNGRIDTLRIISEFGSWKHGYYIPGELQSPAKIKSLKRRKIGNRNKGRRLEVNARTIRMRKPTVLFQPFPRLQFDSNFHLGQSARHQLKEVLRKDLLLEMESGPNENNEARLEADRQEQQLREQKDQNEKRGLALSEYHLRILRSASRDPKGWGFFPYSY